MAPLSIISDPPHYKTYILVFFYKLLGSDILLKKHEWNGLRMHKITVGPFVYYRRSLVFNKLRDTGLVCLEMGTDVWICISGIRNVHGPMHFSVRDYNTKINGPNLTDYLFFMRKEFLEHSDVYLHKYFLGHFAFRLQ